MGAFLFSIKGVHKGGREMKQQGKTIKVITFFIAMVLTLPGIVKAGQLEPTAPPGSTMHTLDDIYNNTTKSSALPKPEEVTIITETTDDFTDSTTLHTVTPGKTFYLMGVNADCDTTTANVINLTLVQGNTTKILRFFFSGTSNFHSIVSSYPIASVSSGTEIRATIKTSGFHGYVNIWGYEK